MRRVLTMAVFAVLAACGSDSTGPAEAPVTGTYTLRTINGQNLPVIVAQQGADVARITAGKVQLNANGTFSDSTTYSVTEAGQTTTESDGTTGTYVRSGTNVTFTAVDGFSYAMAYDGSATLTQTFEGFTLVYRK